MRRLVETIAAGLLLAGCAPSIGVEDRSVFDLPPSNRALADLTRDVKGKVILHHIDDRGTSQSWTKRLRMGTSFRVELDCVGASGMMIVRVDKSQIPHQCSAGRGAVRLSTIPDPIAVRKVTVQVPKNAKWSILIWKPPQKA